MAADFSHELTKSDRYFLDHASSEHPSREYDHHLGENRYSFYRRRGHSRPDSLSYALAWLRNTAEQAARRLSHETGAEGRKRISAEA